MIKTLDKLTSLGSAKSAHMRFVHSRGHLGLFLGG
jgi:hypothetical protein